MTLPGERRAPATEAWTRRGMLLGHLAMTSQVLRGGHAEAALPFPSRLVLAFEEQFERLDLYDEQRRTGRWRTQFGYGGRDSKDSRCNASGQACYVDAAFTNGRVDPFSVHEHAEESSILSITADRTPPELLHRCFGRPYTSGVLTTKFSFSQMYGYFEARVQLPAGRGYWPAFWGLPVDNRWPPELDVFESLGDRHTVHLGIHSVPPQAKASIPVRVEADLTTGFHDYGLWWDEHVIIWYIDGQEYRRVATPPGMQKPFYWILNFAVGGAWGGLPTADTPFPAAMRIASFKAYRLAKP